MARILLVWELGGNLGHIAPLRAIALELRKRGHQCIFAARDLDATEEYIEPELGPVFQAPIRLNAIRNPLRVQVNYASLLHSTGFDNALSLAARLRAWRELMQTQRCDLVLADHAPTAVIAAASLNIPTMQLGTGFTVPPLTTPFKIFRPDTKVSTDILLHNEKAVLDTLGAACVRLGITAPASLQQAFAHGARAILSYPELDHYHVSRDDTFYGVPNTSQGMAPVWSAGTEPRFFAYLRPSKVLNPVLAALNRMPARVLVRVGGVAASKLKSHERPGMQIVDQSVDMTVAARDCDAYINYASHGTTAEMLLAGKPGLLLSDNIERNLVAIRVQQLGAGLSPPAKGDFNLSQALRQLVDDHTMRNAAEAFATRYRSHHRTEILPKIAEHALGLIKAPRRGASTDS